MEANKMDAGASTFLSQPIYTDDAIGNIEVFKRQLGAKVYAGILPPISYRNAMFLDNEVPGIRLPEQLLHKMKDIEVSKQQLEGVHFVVDIAKKALKHADGLYLMLPFGRVNVAAQFFDLFNKKTIR